MKLIGHGKQLAYAEIIHSLSYILCYVHMIKEKKLLHIKNALLLKYIISCLQP